MKFLRILFLTLIVMGLTDASYLTWEHYSQTIPPCSTSIFVDCGRVLDSPYAVVFGIPLALLGGLHYAIMLVIAIAVFLTSKSLFQRLLFLSTAAGILVSIYLVYLQLAVIGAICLYCMASAVISLLLYILARVIFAHEYTEFQLKKVEITYKMFGKPLFFLLPAEFAHDCAMFFGELFGKIPLVRWLFSRIFGFHDLRLRQKIGKIIFENPLGLAAGYDYKASFTQILPVCGFGFETVGTITNQECEGNTSPRLGRLPKSKSLLVNKGFRNPGAKKIVKKLSGKTFSFPVGISIGVTNNAKIKTQKGAIEDITEALKKFEKSSVKNAYYELNISCPNLKTDVYFYAPKQLKELLDEIKTLAVDKPIFIKMPIEKTDDEVKKMLSVIVKYPFITGVIFGNLQKNRKDKSFVAEEVDIQGKGNFSGKPTERRSNELIALVYRMYEKKLIIIGCGGVFNAEDAYKKIRLGATLVQMITGMIFEGPQVMTQINRGLVDLLKKDGFEHISEAIGADIK